MFEDESLENLSTLPDFDEDANPTSPPPTTFKAKLEYDPIQVEFPLETNVCCAGNISRTIKKKESLHTPSLILL